MRLDDQRRSGNVEDRRGFSVGRGLAGGGIGTVVVILVAMFFGVDPGVLLQSLPQPAPEQSVSSGAPSDQASDFVAAVLGSTEDTWNDLFNRSGRQYEEPKLVLFSGAVNSACGFAQAAVGPFYCPGDQKLYLDVSFFNELEERFRAPGDFAQAYVIAHEVGHHVQNLLGIASRVRVAQQNNPTEANELSIRLELQADCLAGIWASRNSNILVPGDIEEGLAAAAAVGDDRIQMQSRGYISPESFTHGSAAQRGRWFKRGLEGGDLSRCDTFSVQQL